MKTDLDKWTDYFRSKGVKTQLGSEKLADLPGRQAERAYTTLKVLDAKFTISAAELGSLLGAVVQHDIEVGGKLVVFDARLMEFVHVLTLKGTSP